ncbi:MAG: VWA domain-containing protein, partial [Caldilineaceae bacterium]|nr:VWA domain-containing protein [Caldilineaceae bacterium]
VIMHEWGHFADHQFSCNQNPGGAHTLPGFNNGTNGDKLSWGEGYPDYYQSAARTLMPGSGFTSYYIDVSGPTVDFEVLPGTASPLNEGAIAALLWDFLDSVNDGSDTVSHGQARIQKAYTDPGFQANGQCNMARFLTVWKDLAFPTDAATAATVVQNVQIAKPFGVAVAAAAVERAPVTAADSQALAAATPLGYRWWDQVTMVVDNSASMAGPAATPKLDATKALIRERVNDLSAHPQGTEFDLYTFNAGSGNNSVLGEGKFYANQIDPLLAGLTAAGADAGCGVYGLEALTQAAQDKYDGQAWLYTDGDSVSATSTAYFQQQLNDRLVHGSVVLLGGCNALPTVQSNVTGGEKSYLGLAADGSQPGGIVPYLLTAIGTGGQFLYV